MKKFIKIEWDDEETKVSHTEDLNTFELVGVLETTKLWLWEKKQIREEKK